MNGTKKIRGFSYLEIIITVAIVAILGAVVLINTSFVHRYKEKQELDRLVLDIQSTKTQALSTRSRQSVTLEEKGYFVTVDSQSVDLEYLSIDLNSSNIKEIEFTQNGRPGYDGAGTIVVHGKKDRYKVVITPVTGSISVRSGVDEN